VMVNSKWALPECKLERLPRDPVRAVRKLSQFTPQISKFDVLFTCLVSDTKEKLKYKFYFFIKTEHLKKNPILS
jgi:hypothetical protein